MLSQKKLFSASALPYKDPSPLGPFPRHIWIHSNTPQDGLDRACYEIWKRAQGLSEELQLPPLQPAFCLGLSWTLPRDTINSQSNTNLLDDPEGFENIYREIIRSEEREKKLIALCDAQISARSIITGLLPSAKAPKNSKELKDGSMAGTSSTEGSKLEMPLLLKHPNTARAAGAQVAAEETKAAKESAPSNAFSSAKSSAAVSTATAESQAAGQRQQLPPAAKICSKTDLDAVIKNPVAAATQDKKSVKYNGSGSGFSATAVPTAFNQPVSQCLNFLPCLIFQNHFNFPQFQGPFQQARILYQQGLHPAHGYYFGQVVPYSPQQLFQPHYTLVLNYFTLFQCGYPPQQMTSPILLSNTQKLSLKSWKSCHNYPQLLCQGELWNTK